MERLIGTIRREYLDHTLFWTTADSKTSCSISGPTSTTIVRPSSEVCVRCRCGTEWTENQIRASSGNGCKCLTQDTWRARGDSNSRPSGSWPFDLFCQILPEANRTDSASWGNSVQSAFSFFFRHLLRNWRYFPHLALQFSDSWPVSQNSLRRLPSYTDKWTTSKLAAPGRA